MASIPIYGTKVTKVMPKFSFAIPKLGHYINTPSVSISSNTDKFRTLEEDGKFNILNTNTKSIYFNDITYKSARVRDSDSRSVGSNVTVTKSNEYESDNKYYQEHTVKVNGFTTGILTIVSELGIIGSNKIIPPLTKLEFSALYEVKSLGVLKKHYYGNSTNTPNKRVGIIDFTFNLKALSNIEGGDEINEDIVITTILVNT